MLTIRDGQGKVRTTPGGARGNGGRGRQLCQSGASSKASDELTTGASTSGISGISAPGTPPPDGGTAGGGMSTGTPGLSDERAEAPA